MIRTVCFSCAGGVVFLVCSHSLWFCEGGSLREGEWVHQRGQGDYRDGKRSELGVIDGVEHDRPVKTLLFSLFPIEI